MDFLQDYIVLMVLGICLCVGYIIKKVIAKDIFGTYVSSLLPINEDLQAALDTMDEDLKLIDVYKVTMPFTGAYPNPKANPRLVVRHI